MEKISVIVPVYNGEKTIEKCLASILNQTLPIYEIIVVNDGSTDNTSTIIKKIALIYDSVKVITIQNGGVSNARNIALAQATGDYIGFVDSDDFIEPNMYESLLHSLTENASDCSICGYYTEKDNVTTPITYGSNGIIAINEFINAMFTNDSIGGFIWNRLFKKTLFTSPTVFDTTVSVCEDKMLQLNMFINSNYKVSVVNDPLYHYVYTGSSATTSPCYFKGNQFIYKSVFEKMQLLLESKCNNNSDELASYKSSLLENYRSILEYSMYMLLTSKHSSHSEINLMKQELRKVKKAIFQNTSINFKGRFHYWLLANLPIIYKHLRLSK